MTTEHISARAEAPSFGELVTVFARIGVLSFGGPAGQIALMHRVLVDEKKWVDEKSYLGALNFCMLLPGPEAMQLATWVGWRLHGVAGGLAAGLLFVLPGAAIMLALSLVYALAGNVPLVEALFVGVKAAVLAIVIEALLRVARRALSGPVDWLIAAGAFVGIFFFALPFPVIVLAAAILGYMRAASTADAPSPPAAPVPLAATVRTVTIWLAVWIVPLAALTAVVGVDHVLARLAWFFSVLAIVTFGGAYAVLAYMAQEVVQQYGWLTAGEMLDGLGLAETTPGPLILVTQFVGFLAAFRHGGEPAILVGVLGAVVTLWATFAPCFLWIFAGAPYLARVSSAPRLRSALAAVTASVVGVILNLSVWFALHVLFRTVDQFTLGPLQLHMPLLATLDLVVALLAIFAALMLFVAKRGMLVTLAASATLGLAAHAAGLV